MRVLVCGLATTKIDPPCPPSPPLGPPRGTNFSRRNAMAPRPPWPAATWISTSSTNTPREILPFERDDANHAAARAVVLELDLPVDLREQGVVFPESDVQSRP